MSNTKLLNVDEAEAEIISFEMEKTVVMGEMWVVDMEMHDRYMEDSSMFLTWDKAIEIVAKNPKLHISIDGFDGFIAAIILLDNGKLAYLVF